MSRGGARGARPERRGEALADVVVLRDEAETRGPKDGFLLLRRLIVRNVYRDGESSPDYPCDIVSRTHVDAVTVLLYERRADGVHVGLRENLRVPVYLRRTSADVPFKDSPQHVTMLETVAGVLEHADAELPLRDALRARAVLEAREEVGLTVDPAAIVELGGASFPSPGITDEKVFFCAAAVDFARAAPAEGDGSAMEHVGGLVVLPLKEALTMCDDGRIADMKTEIALRRFAERDQRLRPRDARP